MRSPERYEDPGVAAGVVAKVALGFLLFVALALAGLLAYYKLAVGRLPAPTPQPFAAPALQVDPRQDRLRLEAAQRALLEGYAWVDRDKTVARIPIERAMAIVAARGRAAFDPVVATPATRQAEGASPGGAP